MERLSSLKERKALHVRGSHGEESLWTCVDAQSFHPLCVSVPTLHNIKNAFSTEFGGQGVIGGHMRLSIGKCAWWASMGSLVNYRRNPYSDFILKDISQDI